MGFWFLALGFYYDCPLHCHGNGRLKLVVLLHISERIVYYPPGSSVVLQPRYLPILVCLFCVV